MLIQKLRDILYAAFIGSLLFVSPDDAFAQNRSPPAGNTAAREGKASADSCDGAIDIVPVKSMTFTRKRRPSKTEQRPSRGRGKDRKDSKTERDKQKSGPG